MRYVALLRGINVGGANPVSMARLRGAFESAGMTAVRTYINSGNVVFSAGEGEAAGLAQRLEDVVEREIGAQIGILVVDADRLRGIVTAIPDHWVNNDSMRCDVFFLWKDVDSPQVLDQLEHDPDLEDVTYQPGAVIRRVDRANVTRSRLTRVMGTPLYKRMTVRNCNTARKLLELVEGE